MLRNTLIGIEAILMVIILVSTVFLPLIVIKVWMMFWLKILPKMPKGKPRWIEVTANKLDKFYSDYLEF